MKPDTGTLRHTLHDPAYVTTLLTRLFGAGDTTLPCAREDYHLTPDQTAAVLAIDGGSNADDDITPDTWCPLHPHHPGPHYSLLRYLSNDTVVWIKWLGRLSELVTLTECTLTTTDHDTCPLFTGHTGPCPPPRTD
ncbi:hypothetical protein ACFVT5_40055 [Streptomyces sp. NPDC058001]|uniref:hypothetical protein n=1 Tax=Streptomyces sp. NPDC058001 TaxID=3346300 RepID=UPI0036E4655F